jgi:hypothetical protein
MKSLIISLMLTCMALVSGIGQQIRDDLYLSAGCDPSEVVVGEHTQLIVFLANNGTREVLPGYIAITISYFGDLYNLLSVSGELSNYFGMYQVDSSTWYGLNTVTMPKDTGFYMYFDVVGIKEYNYTELIVDTNFEPGRYSEAEDQDNHSKPKLKVLPAPLPVTLSSFIGTSKECGQIDLKWVTQSESNNDYIEVQRSRDGRKFETVGKVKGSNQRNGSVYSFTDDASELISGVKYFYRLRQLDFDGKSEIHKVIAVDYKCIGADAALAVYPNPAVDKVNILLTNMDAEVTYKGVIINSEGAEVKHIDLQPGTPYDLQLKDMPEGIYNVRILDQPDNLTKNFIRIR